MRLAILLALTTVVTGEIYTFVRPLCVKMALFCKNGVKVRVRVRVRVRDRIRVRVRVRVRVEIRVSISSLYR